MTRRNFAIWPVLLILVAGNVEAQSAPSDSARLQGTWAMISGSASGSAMGPEYLSQMSRTLSGTELTVTMASRTFFKANIVLHLDQTPRAIDYHMTAGPTAGAVQLGIYEISGDTVRFAFSRVGAARPGDFTTSPGDGRTISAWVRKP